MSDGSARMLRQRHGHSLPPTRIRFHGLASENILSSGLDSCLMSYSIEHDSKNKSLGRASFNKAESRRSGLKSDRHMMPPIIEFDSNDTKQSDWDSIVCVHENLRQVTTWNYIKSTMGKFQLDNSRFVENELKSYQIVATCCCISSCGNYCLIGYSSGHVDLYNMQSGIFRGSYGQTTAHDSSVRGITSDMLNLTTITCSESGEIKFWPFKNKASLKSCQTKFNHIIQLNESINQIIFHRESGMLAVSTDDFGIIIVDCDVRKVVRKFIGHSNRISDMAFSADSRWLLTSSMDCLIKVWDIPSSKLIDCFKFDKAPTSITFSSTSEFLATTHVNDLGIYLWSNKTLYSHVSLRILPDDYEPEDSVTMPTTNSHLVSKINDDSETQMDSETYDDYKIYTSPEQLAFELITLSMMPESRWKNLINLDIIKKRNKPKEAPKAPKLAPFFLPTISDEKGFTFKTAIESQKISQVYHSFINQQKNEKFI
jgi:U3 small nucleolar RNA-associated protein 21